MRNKLTAKEFTTLTFKYNNIWGGLIPMNLIAVGAIISAFMGYWQNIYWLYLAMGYFCIMILGVTIGYHRYVSHKSFETYAPIKYIILFFAMLAGQGSPIFWTAIHRNLHHPHSDTDKDPHTPKKGIATSWFLWLWKVEEKDINYKHIIDLLKNPIYAFCHKYYMPMYWAVNLIIALISFDFWLWFVIVPSFITFHSYAATNSLNHFQNLGYKNYETGDNSVNAPILFPLVLGECWHNNHHGDVKAYHFGRVNWWEVDPSGVVIDLIKKRS
jgi:stearoyl-CoA desaturase (delta-9 desaturase)